MRTPDASTAQRRLDIINQPIAGQLVRLTIPMLYALVAIMGLGLVDSYFIGFLGTQPLAAMGFIVPIAAIISNLALGMGMAISSLNSKLIGANRTDLAARLITDGFYLTCALAIITVGLFTLYLEPVFRLIGADESTLPHIKSFMHIWLLAAPAIMFTMVAASTFRSLGDTRTSAVIAISMTLSNIILDPLLIFGLGPFPEMGMQGAALATAISVVISCTIAFYHLGIKEKLLLWGLPKWAPLKANLSNLLEIAIPALLANAVIPISAAVLTRLVSDFGTDAVAGFGVGGRIEQIVLIIVYALSSTLPMFIGQNIGAGKPQRARQAMQISFRFVMLFQLGIYLLLILFAAPLAAQFSDAESVQKTIILFLWIVPLSHGLSGVVVLINVAMNVLGKPRLALYINLVRLLLFYLPLGYLGAHWFGLKGLFIGIALGNCMAYVLAKVLLQKTLFQPPKVAGQS